MEKLLVSIKNTYNRVAKWFISKLNNFRTTSIVVTILGIVSLLAAVGTLLFYEFAGDYDKEINMQITAFANEPIKGMIMFLSCLIIIVASIVAIYLSFPAIVNREVVRAKRSNLISTFVIGVFELVVAIFIIILLTGKEKIKTTPGFVIMLVILLLNSIVSGLMFIPYFKCVFYMPPIKK